jgi:hypothetical protein
MHTLQRTLKRDTNSQRLTGRSYPQRQRRRYIKKYLVTARGLFNKARTDKNIPEEIKLGNEALAEDPENLDYVFLLSLDIRTNELSASPPNYSHANELTDYSRRAIKLIEAGKVPAVVDKTKWNQNQQLGDLIRCPGSCRCKGEAHRQGNRESQEAATLDPTNASYFLTLGSLYYQEKYAPAATKYQAFPQAIATRPNQNPRSRLPWTRCSPMLMW